MEELFEYGVDHVSQNAELYTDILQNPDVYSDALETYLETDFDLADDLSDLSAAYMSSGTDDVQEEYSLFAGFWDGITLPFNAIRDLANGSSDATWAFDGTGITSEPADDAYNIGFWLGAGGGGATLASSRSSSSNKDD